MRTGEATAPADGADTSSDPGALDNGGIAPPGSAADVVGGEMGGEVGGEAATSLPPLGAMGAAAGAAMGAVVGAAEGPADGPGIARLSSARQSLIVSQPIAAPAPTISTMAASARAGRERRGLDCSDGRGRVTAGAGVAT